MKARVSIHKREGYYLALFACFIRAEWLFKLAMKMKVFEIKVKQIGV